MYHLTPAMFCCQTPRAGEHPVSGNEAGTGNRWKLESTVHMKNALTERQGRGACRDTRSLRIKRGIARHVEDGQWRNRNSVLCSFCVPHGYCCGSGRQIIARPNVDKRSLVVAVRCSTVVALKSDLG